MLFGIFALYFLQWLWIIYYHQWQETNAPSQSEGSFAEAWYHVGSSFLFMLVAFGFSKYVDKIHWLQMGWQKPILSNVFKGSLTAVSLLFLIASALAYFDFISFQEHTIPWSKIIVQGVIFAFIAFGEEAFFRGYIQRNLQTVLSRTQAILIAALIFTIMHMGNPGKNWLALPGIFIGGILLGINYLFTKNLWFGIGLHFIWNFLQGSILGIAVSGLQFPSIWIAVLHGPAWLTGGNFGFEASLLSLLLDVMAIFFLYRLYVHRAAKEPH